MSLIHKALKKAQENKVDMGPSVSIPTGDDEDGEGESGNFLNKPKIKTAIIALALVVAVVLFVYTKFLAGPSQPKPKTAQQAQTKVEGVVPSQEDIEKKAEVEELKDEVVKLFNAGNLRDALSLAEDAYVLAPQDPDVLNNLGVIHRKKGNLPEAKKYLGDALKFNKNCVECLNNMALVSMDESNDIEAVIYLKKVIELDPKLASAYFNLALIMEKEGNAKSAVANYKLFLKWSEEEGGELVEQVKQHIEAITQY